MNDVANLTPIQILAVRHEAEQEISRQFYSYSFKPGGDSLIRAIVAPEAFQTVERGIAEHGNLSLLEERYREHLQERFSTPLPVRAGRRDLAATGLGL